MEFGCLVFSFGINLFVDLPPLPFSPCRWRHSSDGRTLIARRYRDIVSSTTSSKTLFRHKNLNCNNTENNAEQEIPELSSLFSLLGIVFKGTATKQNLLDSSLSNEIGSKVLHQIPDTCTLAPEFWLREAGHARRARGQ
jgi:hypothetical protein